MKLLDRTRGKATRLLRSRWFRRLKQQAVKTVVCMTAIGMFVFLVWSAFFVFQQKEHPIWGLNPTAGAVAILSGILILIVNTKLLRSRRYRWVIPSFKLVFLSLLVIFFVCAFAGIEPLQEYKDRLFSLTGEKVQQVTDEYEQWQADRELAAEEKLVEQEKEVNDLINEERTKRGLSPARWSEEMHTLAKDQSNKMAQQERLFHSNRYALEGGENAWYGEGHNWTPRDIVETWMGSPLHRAWILDNRVRIAGVGITHSDSGMYAAWAFSD